MATLYASSSFQVADSNHTEILSSHFVEEYPKYKDYFATETLIQSIVLCVVSCLLIVANRLKKPTLYWPFIIYMVSLIRYDGEKIVNY